MILKTRITFADVLGFVWDNYEVFLLWNDNGSPVKRRIGSYVNKTFDLDGRTVHEPSTFLGCKRMEALCQEVANNCDQLFIAT